MRKRPAFFLDRVGVRFFDREKGSDLRLELRIEDALLISLPTLFRQIDGGGRHGKDDTHHRQAQLGSKAERSVRDGI